MTILVGNQRGGARDLAVHLMKPENDHIDVHELRGFVSNDLRGALNEAYAISKATRCKQFLYSLSANPPPNKAVSTADFISFIDQAESALGLDGQPRAIVFHEKNGRRHAHCVWSRIKADTLTAVHLPHTKRKLVSLTRDIFLERGWDMPKGLLDKRLRDPRNYTLAQWQQAKRQDKSPSAIKAALQDAWSVSGSKQTLITALKERGFRLARGDRKSYVVIDHNLEIYSLAKWSGLKVRTIKERVGDKTELPGTDETIDLIRQEMRENLSILQVSLKAKTKAAKHRFEIKRKQLVEKQRVARAALKTKHESEIQRGNTRRQARFRRGLGRVWDFLSGEHFRIRRENMEEAQAERVKQETAMDDLIQRHLQQRQRLELFEAHYQKTALRVEHELTQDRRRYGPTFGPEP